MGKLIHFEFRKLFQQKSFYICNMVILLFVFLSIIMSKIIYEQTAEGIDIPTTMDFIKTALTSGNVILIVSILIALFTCEDYNEGTIKNSYARGYSRTQVYLSKWMVVSTASVITCLVCWIGTYGIGSIFFEMGNVHLFNWVSVLLCQLFGLLCYTSLFFTISIFFKKTGGAIAGCIISPMIFSILFTTINSLLSQEKFNLNDYWLESLMGDLTSPLVSNHTMFVACGLMGLYMIVFVGIGLMINRKQEL